MKFQVTLKDPDTFDDAVKEAAQTSLAQIEGLDDEEREALMFNRVQSIKNKCGHWFKYGEYLTIELDTDDGSAVVVQTK